MGAMGFRPHQAMGYGILQSYGFLVENSWEPTLFPKNSMGYYRVWVIATMGYDRVDCNSALTPSLVVGPLSPGVGDKRVTAV